MTSSAQSGPPRDSFIQTLQSLIVAFVLAMTFRGFVTEGFVIPTGSMAPTLMGQHLLVDSRDTGKTFPVGLDPKQQLTERDLDLLRDPMLGPGQLANVDIRGAGRRMGDRILVLKTLYPFNEPDRFDVVVFKNPTNPNGESGNYIKRLIGLPNEKIWLLDGDVFAGPAEDPTRLDDYQIQRKPEHVQRAVWQPIASSDMVPASPDDHLLRWAPMWVGQDWTVEGPVNRTEQTGPTSLRAVNRTIDDWAPYNMLGSPSVRARPTFPTADLRVSAGIVPEADGLVTTLELRARSYRFSYTIDFAQSQVRLSMVADDDDPTLVAEEVVRSIDLPEPGKVVDVECWHVDQKMWMFIDGKLVAELAYDWTPLKRLESSYHIGLDRWKERFPHMHPPPVELEWYFQGAPVAVHRLNVARDLYYLPGRLRAINQLNEPVITGDAVGTHPDQPAVLKDDQFFMLGDNSPASSDSRVWGNPHPIVAHQIDPDPFIVNRKLLLGKAWVVYFPAPYPVTENGRSLIPDFGSLRFIR
jgi:signal peptidase I